jgi:8-oxo-dGTP pyrophosphatase MutT (NUDIX family)
MFREVQEETGIPKGELELLDAYPEPLAYELPPEARSKKTGRGQVGYWFLLRFHGAETTIHVERSAEFSAWQWLPFVRLVTCVVDFRKPVYRRLHERFKPHVAALNLDS